jgi:hypothetical protein
MTSFPPEILRSALSFNSTQWGIHSSSKATNLEGRGLLKDDTGGQRVSEFAVHS